MKNTFLLLLLLFTIGLCGQDFERINVDLELPDSLSYDTEIRIYQGGGITNYNSLFRMYKDHSDQWIAEFYEVWSSVGDVPLRVEKKQLSALSKMEYVFLNLQRSNIFHLPSVKEIRWKLLERGEIEKVQRRRRAGDSKLETDYELLSRQSTPLDGIGYCFQAKSPHSFNEFRFDNPFWYKVKYPEIDEPQYTCELINIIKSEFDIWNK